MTPYGTPYATGVKGDSTAGVPNPLAQQGDPANGVEGFTRHNQGTLTNNMPMDWTTNPGAVDLNWAEGDTDPDFKADRLLAPLVQQLYVKSYQFTGSYTGAGGGSWSFDYEVPFGVSRTVRTGDSASDTTSPASTADYLDAQDIRAGQAKSRQSFIDNERTELDYRHTVSAAPNEDFWFRFEIDHRPVFWHNDPTDTWSHSSPKNWMNLLFLGSVLGKYDGGSLGSDGDTNWGGNLSTGGTAPSISTDETFLGHNFYIVEDTAWGSKSLTITPASFWTLDEWWGRD